VETGHTDQSVGTVIGTCLGFIKAIDEYQLREEFETIKLTAIGALTGFIITTCLKWVRKRVSENPQLLSPRYLFTEGVKKIRNKFKKSK